MMSTLSTENRRAQAGFTLVELAIVLVIVGLLIGGILKGQELIAATRVNSTVSQIKAIDAASYTFRDTFGGLPGDLLAANTKIANCSNANACFPGVVGALGDGKVVDGSGANTMGVAIPNSAANVTEAESFFIQLGKADLIGGINSTAATAVMNDTVLATALGSGSHYRLANSGAADVTTPTVGGTTENNAHYLLISSMGLTTAITTTSGPPPSFDGRGITYKSASSIDTKMDDGIPGTGSVRGIGTAGAGTNDCLSADAAVSNYHGIASKSCGLAVKIMQ